MDIDDVNKSNTSTFSPPGSRHTDRLSGGTRCQYRYSGYTYAGENL